MKNTFKINTKKRNFIITLAIVLIASISVISFTACSKQEQEMAAEILEEVGKVVSENTTSTPEPTETPEVTAEPESTEEPTSTPEATVEPTEEPTSTPEPTEEPESTPQPTEKPEPTEKPSEPTPQPETPKPEEPKPHTHSYTTSVTQPTCTTQGYTTYTCACGHSYKDNYVNGSHNYSNGTCTVCGTADPNYVPPHTHSWTDKTWTEDKVTQTEVEVFVCNGCGAEFDHVSTLKDHQASTGWDGTPAHTGWANTYKWIETITQIIHHYRECACGAREDID